MNALPDNNMNSTARPACGRFEIIIAILASAAATALAVIYIFNRQISNDEPQHLHVAWGVAHGYAQYRDFFDNHMPLFHTLAAPLVRLIGDRPDIVLLMRFCMVPLWVISIVCVYIIGRSLFSKWTGLIASLCTLLCFRFFVTAIEFRADCLWAMFWLLCVAVMVSGGVTVKRFALSGFLLGLAFATSLKSVLLLTALLAASILTLIIYRPRLAGSRRRLFASISVWTALMLSVPFLIAGYFWMLGRFGDFYYCTVTFNSARVVRADPLRNAPFLIASMIAAIAASLFFLRYARPRHRALRQIFIAMLGAVAFCLVKIWPRVTSQDYLVVIPLIIITGTGLLEVLIFDLFQARFVWARVVFVVIAAEIIQLAIIAPWQSRNSSYVGQLAEILRITDPGQAVMDAKGELIFRPRACRFIFESLTREYFKAGLYSDDDAIRQLISASTYVCADSKSLERLPARTKQFIDDNYIAVGSLQIAGKMFHSVSSAPLAFEIPIAGTYCLLSPSGPVSGFIDSIPVSGPFKVEAGRHTLSLSQNEPNVALVWNQAHQRNFDPVWLDSRQQHGSRYQ
jgi:hypothetical protein